ncbi:MAG: hypothetical protein KDJ52_14465 [Anaerolineae bacterium]|nr:hypothetical protein [Anaerolineae bacterium]
MSEKNPNGLRLAIVGTIVIIILLIYMPAPAFSQQNQPSNLQDLIVNGGFEGGFQEEYGIGYGWGGFSNGNAVVGWTFDDWSPVVVEGSYSQQIQIKKALDQNRYAGLYQTVSVVPNEQYKLSVAGLIRSEEGSVQLSDYGYRLQYAIDYKGGTSWELLPEDAWREFPWDEQPLDASSNQTYTFDTFDTTITAQSERLTIFIRGWKKWINDGTGIFNIDTVSFVGPAPTGFQAPVAQVASIGGQSLSADNSVMEESLAQVSEHDADLSVQEADESDESEAVEDAETTTETTVEEETVEEDAAEVTEEDATEMEAADEPAEMESEATDMEETASDAEMDADSEAAPSQESATEMTDDSSTLESAPLPVSGFGANDSTVYILMVGVALLLVLMVGAVTATIRHRNVSE